MNLHSNQDRCSIRAACQAYVELATVETTVSSRLTISQPRIEPRSGSEGDPGRRIASSTEIR